MRMGEFSPTLETNTVNKDRKYEDCFEGVVTALTEKIMKNMSAQNIDNEFIVARENDIRKLLSENVEFRKEVDAVINATIREKTVELATAPQENVDSIEYQIKAKSIRLVLEKIENGEADLAQLRNYIRTQIQQQNLHNPTGRKNSYH